MTADLRKLDSANGGDVGASSCDLRRRREVRIGGQQPRDFPSRVGRWSGRCERGRPTVSETLRCRPGEGCDLAEILACHSVLNLMHSREGHGFVLCSVALLQICLALDQKILSRRDVLLPSFRLC